MIYFDNAATSGVKPQSVINAATYAMRQLSANPGRSGHKLSLAAASLVAKTRDTAAHFFGGDMTEHLIFTKNCTEALNQAILGSKRPGGHVVTTCYEHNSVLRPLFELKRCGLIDVTVAEPDKSGTITPDCIEQCLRENTYLVVTNHVSNVTGAHALVGEIGALCRKKNLLYLVDCAQSAGHEFIDVERMRIDMIAFAGHKGLFAPQGSGGLYFNDRVTLSPILFGGTGTESQSLFQPTDPPESLESGTLATPAIAGLLEGINFAEKNFDQHRKQLTAFTEYLTEGMRELPFVHVYSKPNASGIVSFGCDGLHSTDVADYLDSEYQIAVRGGLHCAPLVHRYLGTEEPGLTRVSLSVFNHRQELNVLLGALRKIHS